MYTYCYTQTHTKKDRHSRTSHQSPPALCDRAHTCCLSPPAHLLSPPPAIPAPSLRPRGTQDFEPVSRGGAWKWGRVWVRVWQGQRLQGLEEWNLPSLPRAPIHRLTSELVVRSVQVSGIGQTLLATLAPHGPPATPSRPSWAVGGGAGRLGEGARTAPPGGEALGRGWGPGESGLGETGDREGLEPTQGSGAGAGGRLGQEVSAEPEAERSGARRSRSQPPLSSRPLPAAVTTASPFGAAGIGSPTPPPPLCSSRRHGERGSWEVPGEGLALQQHYPLNPKPGSWGWKRGQGQKAPR